MNPEEVLTEIAHLIETRIGSPDSMVHVCFWEGKFQVLPAGHTIIDHPILKREHLNIMRKGFSLREWSTLKNQIARIQKEARS